MAIARRPPRAVTPAVDVEALINRGGGPPSGASSGSQAKAVAILLRIPADLLERLDAALKSRPVKLPRHTWILEAIHEKLTRESAAGAKE